MYFAPKQRLSALRKYWPGIHFEPSRSKAVEAYVWKESTAIAGTRFEYGEKPFRRNSKTDWERIKNLAKSGDMESVPPDILIRYFGNLSKINAYFVQPSFVERTCTVFWGPTGTGKSHRAWTAAGVDAYCKDPLSKWWCGYRDQKNVIIDEFRGIINIAHLLRWLDKYPVSVEIKGGSRPLVAENIWITSNLCPEHWYPDVDVTTRDALIRRLNIFEINSIED